MDTQILGQRCSSHTHRPDKHGKCRAAMHTSFCVSFLLFLQSGSVFPHPMLLNLGFRACQGCLFVSFVARFRSLPVLDRGTCAVLHLHGEVLPWKLYLLIGPDTASMVMLGIKKSGEPFVPVTGRLGLKKQKNSATSSSSFAPGGNHCFSFSWRAALLL